MCPRLHDLPYKAVLINYHHYDEIDMMNIIMENADSSYITSLSYLHSDETINISVIYHTTRQSRLSEELHEGY